MPDATAPKKTWWRMIWEDVILAMACTLGLDVVIKNIGPKIFHKLSEMLGDHVTEKITNDKRVELLEEFRLAEAGGHKATNLIRRHKQSIKELKEAKFIELLCKWVVNEPNATIRQDRLKWLNDMSNAEFDQMLYELDHDVVEQWWQRLLRATKEGKDKVVSGLNGPAEWVRKRFSTVDTKSWLFIIVLGLICVLMFMKMKRGVRVVSRRTFPWLAIAIGVLLIVMAVANIVPTSVDRTLWMSTLMLLAAAFFLWRFAFVRNIIFAIIVFIFIPILFFGGRTASKDKFQAAWAKRGQTQVHAEPKGPQVHASVEHGEPAVIPNRNGAIAPLAPHAVAKTDVSFVSDAPAAPPVPAQPCAVPPPAQYGDFSIAITRCEMRGSQVRLAGKVEYDGPVRVNAYFHPFKMSDNAGNVYVVQNARFGDSDSFGTGHSGQWMDAHTSTSFFLNLGPKDASLPMGDQATLIMPCSDQMGTRISFSLTLKQ